METSFTYRSHVSGISKLYTWWRKRIQFPKRCVSQAYPRQRTPFSQFCNPQNTVLARESFVPGYWCFLRSIELLDEGEEEEDNNKCRIFTSLLRFLAYFPYFGKMKVGLWDNNSVCVSVYLPWMPEPVFMKHETRYVCHGTSAHLNAYFIHPSHQSACLHAYPSKLARHWLGKKFTAATNTEATTEKPLGASFSMRCVSCQKSRRLVLPRISFLDI
jgi:hypothetical protein